MSEAQNLGHFKSSNNKTKYPIKGDRKECGCCHKVLSLAKFSKTSYSPNLGKFTVVGYRTFCNKCRSENSLRYQLEKKIERYPYLYVDCENNDCNWIFNKRCLKCPKCGQNKVM